MEPSEMKILAVQGTEFLLQGEPQPKAVRHTCAPFLEHVTDIRPENQRPSVSVDRTETKHGVDLNRI
jgi:hypothetical protein